MIVSLFVKEIKVVVDKTNSNNNELARHRWESDNVKKRINLSELKDIEVKKIYELA